MMPTKPIELHTDPEHAGIRAVIFPLIIVCVILAYYLINALARLIWGINDIAIVLSCILALFAGLGLAALVEMGLKQVWKSGEKVVVDNCRHFPTPKTKSQNQFTQRCPNLHPKMVLQPQRLSSGWA